MVGNNIKEYLTENGLKQTYLADKLGISISKMNDICNRDRGIDCVLYYKICKVLNVPYEFFIEGAKS